MSTFSTAALNEAVNALTINLIKLHSADAGANGTDNVVEDAEAAISFASATNGSRPISAEVDVPINQPSTVSHYSLWQDGVFKAKGGFPVTETFAATGTFTVKEATISFVNQA